MFLPSGQGHVAATGPGVSQFLTALDSTALSDLVNPGERGPALLQILVARVDVGLLGERGVVVTCPPRPGT
jgi:hypothetical protein